MVIQSVFGLFAFCFLAWIMSENRREARIKPVVTGIVLQLAIAITLTKFPLFKDFFLLLNKVTMAFQSSAKAGSAFVFGYLGGGPLPFDEKFPGSSFVLALQALPLILVVSAISSLFFYWRIAPLIVKGISGVLRKAMNLGGAVGLGAAANIFVGMIESPLFIRPYLKEMTRSELFIIMTCGMATIAGNMMVLYASILGPIIPAAMGHILTASIISAPAAITISRLMVPETGDPTAGELEPPQVYSGSMDAITKGTLEGVTLLINIVAMLIVLVALVSLVNQGFALLPDMGDEPVTMQKILGYIMAPLVWLMGIPWNEAVTAGSLMGVKTVLNEFLAYMQLAKLPEDALSPRSAMIMTYAMCGFANLGSLGIMIGGMGAMAPERRNEIVSLGFKSIIAGTYATMMTGAVIGIIGVG